MTRWNLSIPDETDRAVRSYLARKGLKKGDLSDFVNDAVRREVFDRVVRDIKERNAEANPDELMKLIDEAVEWARADSA
ncbi:MAG TPA: ribbon-helix-helix domain-containing protein [Vicinamibacteria bacterium]|nr:ribbon-helix-helix domain-containing protein [Vicinamibacteria bacterium]